ncbi:hypothetical protein BU23DRAFT_596305 [Bimuria novae-zelandiae CBS 107.79]|uniref:Uncharacterized protein n=1 Tax=Bimuria novae-zelandiae CBS 107.79 TaxID=1447943 RepID=A0A6A5VK70_9PLEO|nr:hypothetical protein BU23DRAFT_596305 [Bimuria novae-zelandiae CBS 107.79]
MPETVNDTLPMNWPELISKLSASPASLTPEEIAILRQTPAIPAPNGTTPNFVNPPSIKSIHHGITTALLVLIFWFFTNRIYVKTALMKKYRWDDCLKRLRYAMVDLTAIGAERGNMGTHLWDVNVLDSINPEFMVTCRNDDWGDVRLNFSSMFTTSTETKPSSTGEHLGAKLSTIRRTNEVYITMDDYNAHTSDSASQAKIVDDDDCNNYVHQYDERGLPEIFDGSGYLRTEDTHLDREEEREGKSFPRCVV